VRKKSDRRRRAATRIEDASLRMGPARAALPWNNAIKIAELIAAREKTKGSRTEQWEAKSRFLSVAHLWGAWSIRKRSFWLTPRSVTTGGPISSHS
jgi:hypothetical protein